MKNTKKPLCLPLEYAGPSNDERQQRTANEPHMERTILNFILLCQNHTSLMKFIYM